MNSEALFSVLVDPRRCEGAAACVKACPTRVFRMVKPPAGLPLIARMKVAIHGGLQAEAQNESACNGCQLCLVACPERAISVRERAP